MGRDEAVGTPPAQDRRGFLGALATAGTAAGIGAGLGAASPADAAPAGDAKIGGVGIVERLTILDEMARYSWAIDTGAIDDYLDRFWPDGHILHPKPDGSPGRFDGHEAIRGWLGPNFAQCPNQTFGHQHQFNAAVLSPEGEGVRVNAYIVIMRHEFHRQYWPGGPSWRMGSWHALFTRRADRWRIASLDVRMWTDTAFGAGAAIVDRQPGMPGTR